jgi:hypothetical protein
MTLLKCKKCNKEIKGKGKTGFCRSCSQKNDRHPNYKNGNYRKNIIYICIEENCNNVVSQGNRRCNSCALKKRGIKNINKKYYCIKCNKEIGYNSWHYGSKMCLTCCKKGRKRTETTRIKISKANKNKKLSLQSRQKMSKSAINKWYNYNKQWYKNEKIYILKLKEKENEFKAN